MKPDPCPIEHISSLPEVLDDRWACGAGEALVSLARQKRVELDASCTRVVGTLAALQIVRASRVAQIDGRRLRLTGLEGGLRARLEQISRDLPDSADTTTPPRRPPVVDRMGDFVLTTLAEAGKTLGVALRAFPDLLAQGRRPGGGWPGATIMAFVWLGAGAVPVVVLLTSLIALTLALLMGGILAEFGATAHLATMMGVAFVREVGPLLAAIVLAGRSGSAVAAELASMKVQEEVDALRSLGADPALFLAAPRIAALALAAPCLTVLANASGVFTGMVVGSLHLGLDPRLYLEMVRQAVGPWDLAHSVGKSIVFGMVVGAVAVRAGLAARGGSQAVGEAATRAVVGGIVAVVLVVCIFALGSYL